MVVACLYPSVLYSQKIIDPCFLSVLDTGFYWGSADNSHNVENVCKCESREIATDMLVWNGTSWDGPLWFAFVDIVPPPGCNQRAIWMGPPSWTSNGEAFGLKFDKPLEAGKQVSFKFTYASNGSRSDGNFAPMVYTTNTPPLNNNAFANAHKVGHMPAAHNSWLTESITFVPTQAQQGDQWIILHADVSSGIVLGDCNFGDVPKSYLKDSVTFCSDEPFEVSLPIGEYYSYSWNTGSVNSKIIISEPGEYIGYMQYGLCSSSDTLIAISKDCETRLELPNVFSRLP